MYTVMSEERIAELNDYASREIALDVPTIEALHNACFAANLKLQCGEVSELWLDSDTNEIVNLRIEGQRSNNIEPGGLGFDDQVEAASDWVH